MSNLQTQQSCPQDEAYFHKITSLGGAEMQPDNLNQTAGPYSKKLTLEALTQDVYEAAGAPRKANKEPEEGMQGFRGSQEAVREGDKGQGGQQDWEGRDINS